jgi:hypothetical protein
MRSKLNEVCLIDRYLFRQISDEEAGTFESSLLVDDALAEKVEAQRLAHRLIRRYGHRKELGWLDDIYRHLLTETNFANQLKNIFT